MALRGPQRSTELSVLPAPTRPQRPWWLWVGGASVFCIIFIAFGAIAVLLRVPALPNCPAVFWPIASASVRLYCAELAASKKNLDDLLDAIALLEDLPADHELRSQADQYLETWTQQVLGLAEEVFQAGDIERAIATVQRIPAGVSSFGLVESTIRQWRELWDRATELERTFREQMAEGQWAAAAGTLTQLRRLENRHWTTEKLTQLRLELDGAQRDDGLLQRARRVIAGGNVEAIKAIIEELQKIAPERAAYGAAQAEIEAATDRLIALARSRLQAGDADGALEIAQNLPDQTKSQAEANDLRLLAAAQNLAAEGTPEALEQAISQASRVDSGRPLHNQAQQLVAQWRRQGSDGVTLNRARQLAAGGEPNDLIAAIAEANKISDSSPIHGEAQRVAASWGRQLREQRDRPLLDGAEALARQGGIGALQQAIAQAQRIDRASPLAGAAQERIRSWSNRLSTLRDRPQLDQAQAQAAAGDWRSALQLVENLPRDSALRSEANRLAGQWRSQLEGMNLLERSRRLAAGQGVDGLVSAMDTANRIDRGSPAFGEARSDIDRWGNQLLDLARSQARRNPTAAIAIAQRVPRYSSAAAEAQTLIQEWRQWLQPAPVVTPPAPNPQATMDSAPAPAIEEGGWNLNPSPSPSP
jgi:hypothetical protein